MYHLKVDCNLSLTVFEKKIIIMTRGFQLSMHLMIRGLQPALSLFMDRKHILSIV